MQGIIDWWNSISWADFSVGVVLAALVTAVLSVWAHRYDKNASLEEQSKNHQHEITENTKAHERDIQKLRLQAADAEKAKFVGLLRSFLKESYRYHTLTSDIFNAAEEVHDLVLKYGKDGNGYLAIDPS